MGMNGAGDVTRTHDLLITNQLHYRLCYTSDPIIIIDIFSFVKGFFEKNSKLLSIEEKRLPVMKAKPLEQTSPKRFKCFLLSFLKSRPCVLAFYSSKQS